MNRIENVPTDWVTARDELFFRILVHALDDRFLEMGSCLLGENDPESAEDDEPGCA